MEGAVRANGQEGVRGKTLSICITLEVANEQNLGDPYPTYQSAHQTLARENHITLAAASECLNQCNQCD